jgi:hypothetical protein
MQQSKGDALMVSDEPKCPIHNIFCPVHADVQLDIRSIQSKQDTRHCGAHEAMLHTVQRDIDEVKVTCGDQWDAINQLRRFVYIGVGGVSVAAFLGSIVGQLMVSHFGKH